jgi:hypothetical protein
MRRNLLKENSTLLDAALRVVDPLLAIAAGAAAYRLYFDTWDMKSQYIIALLAVALLAFAASPSFKLYQSQRGISFAEEVRAVFLAWLAIAVTGGVFLFLTKTGPEISRGWALLWMTRFSRARGVARRDPCRVARNAAAGAQSTPPRHRRRGCPWTRDRAAVEGRAVEWS